MTDQTLKKSSLFLLELIIVLLFFSFCTAVCINLFVKAKIASTQSYDLNNSVLAAQNAVECFKATDADAKEIASLLGGTQNNNTVSITYDKNWNVTKKSDYIYKLTFTINPVQENIISADLTIVKDTTTLYSLSAVTFVDTTAGGD